MWQAGDDEKSPTGPVHSKQWLRPRVPRAFIHDPDSHLRVKLLGMTHPRNNSKPRYTSHLDCRGCSL